MIVKQENFLYLKKLYIYKGKKNGKGVSDRKLLIGRCRSDMKFTKLLFKLH